MSDFICPEGASLIPLQGKNGEGKFALVDTADLDLVSQHKWTSMAQGYVIRYESENNRTVAILMHHTILGKPEKGLVVDHRNGNTLDNRRCNLRFVGRLGNSQNARPRKPNRHGLIGVAAHRNGRWYRAVIRSEGVKHRSEWFDTPEKAHQEYLRLRALLHGEFDPSLREVI